MRAERISNRLPFRIYVSVLLFSVIGTILQRTILPEPTILAPICSALMLLSGVAVLFRNIEVQTSISRAGLAVLALFLVGLTVELVGLYSKFPFGEYRYTGEWQPSVQIPGGLEFPLLLPVAWVLVVGASTLILPSPCPWRRSLLAAALATAIDFFMEPTMIHILQYWTWPGHAGLYAPLTNAFGWFLTSLLGSLAFQTFAGKVVANQQTRWVLGGYLLFLAFLGFENLVPSIVLALLGAVCTSPQMLTLFRRVK